MVRTSMLPGRGTIELSASPGMDHLLAGGNFGDIEKPQFGHRRQHSTLAGITIEELQPVQACRIKIIVDILGQIGLYLALAQTETWHPFSSDQVQTGGLKAVLARLLKYGSQVECRFKA